MTARGPSAMSPVQRLAKFMSISVGRRDRSQRSILLRRGLSHGGARELAGAAPWKSAFRPLNPAPQFRSVVE